MLNKRWYMISLRNKNKQVYLFYFNMFVFHCFFPIVCLKLGTCICQSLRSQFIEFIKPRYLEFFKMWPRYLELRYLEYPAISNFLLDSMKVRDSGTPLYSLRIILRISFEGKKDWYNQPKFNSGENSTSPFH